MSRKLLTLLAAAAAMGAVVSGAWVPDAKASSSDYHPVLDPANFVAVVDNPYFPLPVGRTLVWERPFMGSSCAASDPGSAHRPGANRVADPASASRRSCGPDTP